jgi:deoxyxylulose-5-phosphate synthase
MDALLERIQSPAQLRHHSRESLPGLADELRERLIETVSQTGGHFSSNLGTIELTIALHYVFNTPEDRLIWDVGHQTYAHKILTGRNARMGSMRQLGGLSGFHGVKKVFTTRLELRIRRPAFLQHWVWRWPRSSQAVRERLLPSSVMVR